jgi:carboxypeptidase C (cathepsin A)
MDYMMNPLLTRREILGGSIMLAGLAARTSPAQTVPDSAKPTPAIDATDDKKRAQFAASLLGNGKRTAASSVMIRGAKVDYALTLGAIELKDEGDKPSAHFVYTAYTRRGVADTRARPITFAWSGGPSGSAAGPQFRLGPHLLDHNLFPPPDHPVKLLDNANTDSILDRTDLVMVDPVGTGWTVATGSHQLWDFYGVATDAASVAQFINRYLEESKRKGAPVYLTGQSYGTIRLPVAVHFLQNYGVPVSGAIFVSSALNGFTTWEKSGNYAPYYLKLPNYAAVAWREKRPTNPAPTVEEAVKRASEFALTDYLTTLIAWPEVGEERRKNVLERLQELTGIAQDVWANNNLRLDPEQFRREMFPKGNGPHDVSYYRVPPGEDPTAALVRIHLGVTEVPQYRNLAPGIYARDKPGPHPWDTTDYGSFFDSGGYLIATFANYFDDMAAAMKSNPKLRVQQHSGYYDLGCASFATNWGWRRIDIPESLRGNIQLFDYAAGHGISETPELTAHFMKNVAAFYPVKES